MFCDGLNGVCMMKESSNCISSTLDNIWKISKSVFYFEWMCKMN